MEDRFGGVSRRGFIKGGVAAAALAGLIELEPELMTRTVFAIVGILHVLIDVPLARLSKL